MFLSTVRKSPMRGCSSQPAIGKRVKQCNNCTVYTDLLTVGTDLLTVEANAVHRVYRLKTYESK